MLFYFLLLYFCVCVLCVLCLYFMLLPSGVTINDNNNKLVSDILQNKEHILDSLLPGIAE